MSLAICSNGSAYTLNKIAVAMLKATYGQDYKILDFTVYKVDKSELKKYTGEYSSDQIPLNLKIFIKDGQLMAQGTGQPEFPLNPVERQIFKFDMAGVKIEFNPEKNQLTLFQGGGQFLFKRK